MKQARAVVASFEDFLCGGNIAGEIQKNLAWIPWKEKVGLGRIPQSPVGLEHLWFSAEQEGGICKQRVDMKTQLGLF